MKVASPIIIIGMHRSGTSLLCRMLGELGVFWGHDTSEVNNESLFFVETNRWLFEQCGAAWDRPLPVKILFRHATLYACSKKYINNALLSSFSASFVGSKSSKGIYATPQPWGWKDPRSTFTLPVWLDIFPDAKVINVLRHGVDVASSLKLREEKYLERKCRATNNGQLFRGRQIFRRRLDHRKMMRLFMSVRCHTLAGGLALWEEYVAQSIEHEKRYSGRIMTVSYEKLLSQPQQILGSVCSFCSIRPAEEKLQSATSGIRSDRANAYERDPNLRVFAEEHKELLAQFGY